VTQPLRIGLIADSHYPRLGGMEHENHWLAAAWQRLPDTEIAVACSTMPEVPRNFPYPYPVHRHRSFSLLTPWLRERAARRMIAERRIAILHGAMLHGGGYRAVRLGQRLGLPVAVRAHGADLQTVPEIGYGAALDPALAARVSHALRHADLVSVPSNEMRAAALAAGAAAENVVVVPPGTDAAAMETVPHEDMRARHQIAPDDVLIVTVGRNRPIKRMHLLLAALRLLVREVPRLRCLCVGPTEDLPDLIRRLNLGTVAIPIGPIRPAPADACATAAPAADLVNFYRAADAYAATSYRESFGLAALEAMACGTPALVTRGQGVEDVIVDGVNGSVVDDQTPAGIAGALKQLLEARLPRDRVRASVAPLTWALAASRLRAHYCDLLARRIQAIRLQV
jgi:D-inositol-3-phosphate glycosyltransferase